MAGCPTANNCEERAGPAPDRMALLHSLAFTALRLSLAQLDAFSTRLGAALLLAADQAGGVDDAEKLRHAAGHLEGHRATFHRLAGDSLQQELLGAVEAAAEQVSSGLASGAMDLSLITFEAMERKVLIDNLSQAIDNVNADLLAVLSIRVAYWLGAGDLGMTQNPFRSEVFLSAMSKAWEKFDLQGASHQLVLQQLRPEIFLRLAPVWEALNQEFAIRNVLPDAEQTYRRRKAVPESLPAPSRADTLRQWLAPEGVLNLIEARALQLLETTLAHLLRDEKIPPAVRALVARLQPVLRKVVVDDNAFFFDENHPVRRFLEVMIKAGLGCAPDRSEQDVLCQAIEGVVAQVATDKELPPAIWSESAQALEDRIKQEDCKLDDRLAASATEALRQEDASRVQRLAEKDVAARIETGDVPEFLEVFLQSHWARVLAFAYSVRESRPDVLPAVLKAMDDLIATLRTKSSAESRKELVNSLPALLSLLNAWLNVIKWDGAEREAFFATLAEQHASAMRTPAELSQRAILEMRMETMQKASEHELGRRIQEQQDAALAEYLRLVNGLVPGDWAEFVRNDGSRLNCKLLWISPARGMLIFSARQGQLLFTLAEDALAQALRAGRVELIASGRMVEQALTAALRELGAVVY